MQNHKKTGKNQDGLLLMQIYPFYAPWIHTLIWMQLIANSHVFLNLIIQIAIASPLIIYIHTNKNTHWETIHAKMHLYRKKYINALHCGKLQPKEGIWKGWRHFGGGGNPAPYWKIDEIKIRKIVIELLFISRERLFMFHLSNTIITWKNIYLK